MLSRTFGTLLRALARLPFVYPLLAFVLARRIVVSGWSMYPTLAPGEYVLFDALAYRLGLPRRGDVVLALHPTRPQQRIVKRVAAVPGDRVAISDGSCWVNGAPYGEPASSTAPAGPGEEWTLGDGEYLLLGDAPEVSTDARHFGPVARANLRGRAWLVYWPLGRFRKVSSAGPR
jgi:signal peptidase I